MRAEPYNSKYDERDINVSGDEEEAEDRRENEEVAPQVKRALAAVLQRKTLVKIMRQHEHYSDYQELDPDFYHHVRRDGKYHKIEYYYECGLSHFGFWMVQIRQERREKQQEKRLQ
jgi:hypothetical protein